MKEFFIIVLILLAIINVLILVAKRRIAKFLRNFFGTSDIKKVVELSKIENQNTPKTLSGMESIALPNINRDFPDININELKRQAESAITNYLEMVENKEYIEIKYASESVKSFIKSRINDLSSDDIVRYDSIKIHRTIVNKYEKSNGIATIYFQTGLEYMYKKNDDSMRKIQDRFETEFIYIIDEEAVGTKVKAIGLNCPNCGAPIKNIGNKTCEYCGTGVVDIVKRTWYLNSINNK